MAVTTGCPGFPVEIRGVDQRHAVFLEEKTAYVVAASSAKQEIRVRCGTGRSRHGPVCIAVLLLPDVSLRQTEHSGPMDWPPSGSDCGPFSCLVDATAFRYLTLAWVSGGPPRPRNRNKPAFSAKTR
jgi:hypothetical protein